MASNSKVGATVKQEHKNRRHSSQQFVHQSSQVLHKEVKRELSPAPTLPTIQVCPINVGQGDSILVKLKYKKGQEYNYLIDGGHAKHYSNIISCMDEYGVMTGHDIQLHGIIVTHPDSDHLNGVTKLLEKHRQAFSNDYDVIITEAFYWRSKHCQDVCTRFLKLIDKVYHKRDIFGTATCLRPGLKCYFPKESGCLLRCTAREDKIRRIQPSETFVKEEPKHVDVNETSILTVINEYEGKCDAVLTGDSTATEILPLVEGKEIGIFQVPHHGSSPNSRLKDKSKLLKYSEQYNLSIAHNNEVKEILLFYSTFRAQCYLISAGGTESYKHPHRLVLQGIILVNSLRHQECVMVLTNSRGLNSEKLKQLHRLAPEWTRYVKIYHLDDVFFTELHVHHTSLRPERCISDVRANTVEWTPEGYINRTKMMLPVKPTISDYRPLEKNRFIEQSTVEITVQGTLKFSAHIVCIPLPHNPRSGDIINCCYVIEESIASGVDLSKALFLLDNDERVRSLSRAKKYVLFQYINSEWQRKQLPATVQDKLPRASPCHIPYDSINSLWLVQDSSTQISPSLTPQQRNNSLTSSLQQEQNISPQTTPSHIPHQSANSAQPIQNVSLQTPPNHTPHQNIISTQPVLNSSPQISSHNTQQLHQGISTRQIGSEGATAATSNNTAQAIPQATRHRPSPAQHYHEYESPTKGCRCKLTDCSTNRCDCKKHGLYCGLNCRCTTDCKNNEQHAFQPAQGQPRVMPFQPAPESLPQISPHNTQQLRQNISILQVGSGGATAATSNNTAQATPQATQHRPSPAQHYHEYESPTTWCRCKLTDCSTNRCGCKKHGLYCGLNCRCTTDCKNNEQHAFQLAQGQPTVMPLQPALNSSPQSTMQQLHQDINALQINSGGATLATSQSTAPEVLIHVPQHGVQATQHNTMRPSPAQYYGPGVYESPTKGCRCKLTDCSTNRCGCKKLGLYCGRNCRCTTDCKNNQFQPAQGQPRVMPFQPALDSSPQSSPHNMQQVHQDINALQISSEGAKLGTNQYGAPEVPLDVPQHGIQATQHATMRPSPVQYYERGGYESPTNGCRCELTDCSTNICGCKKHRLYCGLNCRCTTDCKNNQFQLAQGQPRVMPSQPALDSSPHNIPDQTKIAGSLIKRCVCTTGCGTGRCGCKKQGLRCGPSCKCKTTYFNCEN